MYYGKMRTADWPRRIYPPAVAPAYDPSGTLRWCEYAGHMTTDPAPDKAGKGCSEHKNEKWRNNGDTRWCDQCAQFKPRTNFGRESKRNMTLSRVCNDCLPVPAIPRPLKAVTRTCLKCREALPRESFPRYGTKKGGSYGDRCLDCTHARSKRKAELIERRALMLADFEAGMTYEAIGKKHGIMRQTVTDQLYKARQERRERAA